MAKIKIQLYHWGREDANVEFKPEYTTDPRDVVTLRGRMKFRAEQYIEENENEIYRNIRHVVYYSDKRTGDDLVWQASFYYTPRLMTDHEFKYFTEMIEAFGGFVGAIQLDREDDE